MTTHVGTTWSAQSNHLTTGEPDPDRNNTFRALCRQDVRLYVDGISQLPDHVSTIDMTRRRWCKLCANLQPNDPRIPVDPQIQLMHNVHQLGVERGRTERGNEPAQVRVD